MVAKSGNRQVLASISAAAIMNVPRMVDATASRHGSDSAEIKAITEPPAKQSATFGRSCCAAAAVTSACSPSGDRQSPQWCGA